MNICYQSKHQQDNYLHCLRSKGGLRPRVHQWVFEQNFVWNITVYHLNKMTSVIERRIHKWRTSLENNLSSKQKLQMYSRTILYYKLCRVPITWHKPLIFSSVPAIQEVEIKGGSAHATAIHGSPNWTPEKAFILGNPTGWHNGLTEMKRILPVMVWYEFPANKIFTPGRISFRLGQDCCPDQGPTIWQFVGKLLFLSTA